MFLKMIASDASNYLKDFSSMALHQGDQIVHEYPLKKVNRKNLLFFDTNCSVVNQEI